MNNISTRLIIFIAAIVLFSSCVSTKSVYLNPSMTQYNPVPADSVRIFTTEAELDTLEYVRVAIIEATGNTDWTSQTGMLKAMRKKAGKIGANAILLPTISEPGAATKIAGAVLGIGAERKGNVIALRILGVKKKQSTETDKK